MNIGTIKLREAHVSEDDGKSSLCSILWAGDADHIVTASSSDNAICIHDAASPSNTPKFLRNHGEGVRALALSPDSTCLASGSLDHSVKLYEFPGGNLGTNTIKFTLPIRAVAFNKSGSVLAVAGDGEGIKLVDVVKGTITRVLTGHKGSVTSLAFDPKNEYLVSLDSIGTVVYWELQSGNILHDLKAIAPNNGSNVTVMNILAWSPDGELLAVPGLKNDVVMYDRGTAEKLFFLRGGHFQPICFLSWSPNGKYIATTGLDKQILIWDIGKKRDIERQKFSECISSMSWKPQGNALAVIDVMGKYGVWESAATFEVSRRIDLLEELYALRLQLHDKQALRRSLSSCDSDEFAFGPVENLNEAALMDEIKNVKDDFESEMFIVAMIMAEIFKDQ